MKWSWRLGQLAGIGIYMHATFLILLAWVGMASYAANQSLLDVVSGIAFISILFFIVVLHELGHALAARRYGIQTRDITLLPIGGLARLEKMPDKPFEEFVVAIAGPAVNVALAIVFFVVLMMVPGLTILQPVDVLTGNVLVNLFWINIILAVFNMIPAFPMDGGRILRSLLAMGMDYVKATRIAATIGQAMAFGFGFIGLLIGHPFLILIAVFVWIGATQEARMVEIKSVLGGVQVGHIMVSHFQTLSSDDTLKRAIEHTLEGFQHDFPVVEDGRVIGVLTRSDMLKALHERGKDVPVREVMHTEFEQATPFEQAEKVFARLQSCECRSVPVIVDGRVVGIVTMEHLGEYLMIRGALKE